MAVCLVRAAKGGVGAKGDVHSSIHLFILQDDAVQDCGLVGADAQLAHGGVALVCQQNVQQFALLALDFLKLSAADRHLQRGIQLSDADHGAVDDHFTVHAVLKRSDISLAGRQIAALSGLLIDAGAGNALAAVKL